jgi:hypothetical protein
MVEDTIRDNLFKLETQLLEFYLKIKLISSELSKKMNLQLGNKINKEKTEEREIYQNTKEQFVYQQKRKRKLTILMTTNPMPWYKESL